MSVYSCAYIYVYTYVYIYICIYMHSYIFICVRPFSVNCRRCDRASCHWGILARAAREWRANPCKVRATSPLESFERPETRVCWAGKRKRRCTGLRCELEPRTPTDALTCTQLRLPSCHYTATSAGDRYVSPLLPRISPASLYDRFRSVAEGATERAATEVL